MTALSVAPAPSVRPVLDRLGLHATIATEGHLPSIGSWSAWGGTEPWGRDFIFNRFGHGWHLDRRRFDALLRQTAQAAGAKSATAAVVASEALPTGGFRLHLAGGHEMTTRIVLDATGRSASFFLYEVRSKRRTVLGPPDAYAFNAEWSRDGLQVFFTKGARGKPPLGTDRIFWDGTGTGNVLQPNRCLTSVPPGLC